MIKTSEDKRFCVYLHLDKEGVIRYVGSGTKARPTEFTKYSRSNAWKKFFTYNPQVVIVEDNLSKEDSISLEYFMYHACNTNGQLINKNPPSSTRELDLDVLRKLFFVDSTSKTGLRLRADRPTQRLKAGEPAGFLANNKNKKYWVVKANGTRWLVHRIIFALTYGNICPGKVIDHIDGNGLNNSVSNLRQVESQSNSLNRKPNKRNNTGVSGITRLVSSYTGQISFLVIFNVKQKKRFTVNKQGSEDRAFEAAKLFKMYHINRIEGSELSIHEQQKLTRYLQNEDGITCNTAPTRRKHLGWNVRVKINSRQHNIGTYPTYEEAIAARDAFVADYNSKIKVEL